MSWWVKMDVNYDSHPQILQAGWEGAIVYERIIRIMGLRDFDTLPRQYLEAEYLSRVSMVPVTIVTKGIEAIKSVGLITEDGVIPGWEKWKPQTSKERTRRWRERENNRLAVACDVTVTPVTLVTARPDQIRPDHKKKDICEVAPHAARSRSLNKQAKELSGEVISFLNELAGGAFRVNDTTVSMIRARCADGYVLRDFKKVIWSKTEGPKNWLADEKMRTYVRPSTLFQKTKFPEYLEQARREFGYDAKEGQLQVLPSGNDSQPRGSGENGDVQPGADEEEGETSGGQRGVSLPAVPTKMDCRGSQESQGRERTVFEVLQQGQGISN
jgi:uncharacterized phage protein (TIGR02220 family)